MEKVWVELRDCQRGGKHALAFWIPTDNENVISVTAPIISWQWLLSMTCSLSPLKHFSAIFTVITINSQGLGVSVTLLCNVLNWEKRSRI